MSEKKIRIVEYSNQSIENAKEIVFYLKTRFAKKELDNFFKALIIFEKIVIFYPNIYPASQKKRIRRAVLSKVLSLYYSVNKNIISIISIFDNRWDETSKLK
jgi:hypothetical protein